MQPQIQRQPDVFSQGQIVSYYSPIDHKYDGFGRIIEMCGSYAVVLSAIDMKAYALSFEQLEPRTIRKSHLRDWIRINSPAMWG